MSDVTNIPAPMAAPTLTNAPLNVPAGTTVVPPPPSVSAPGAMPPPMPGLPAMPGMPPLTVPVAAPAQAVQPAPVATIPQAASDQAAPVADIPAPPAQVVAEVPARPAPPPVQQAAPAQDMVPAQQAVPAPAQALVHAQQAAPVPFDEGGFPITATISEAMNALGFEGVSFDGYGIVPNIVLNKTEFEKDGVMIPSEFMVKINGSRNKFLYSWETPNNPKGPRGLCYTYDKVNDANGHGTVADFYAEAAAQGQPVREAHYYEVDAVLLETGEAVKLSVPVRGSGSAFARFLTQCAAARKRPQDAQVLVKRGEKVTKTNNDFYPWCFEIVGWYR